MILAVACAFSPNWIGPDPAVINFPELIAKSGLPWRGGIIWTTTAVLIIWLLRRRPRWRWLVFANLVGFIAFFIFLVMPAMFFLDQALQMPLRELSEMVAQLQQPGEELLMIGFQKPSVAFYTQGPVHFFKVCSFFKEDSRHLDYLKNSVEVLGASS